MIILFLAFLLSLPSVKTDPFSPSFSKNTYSISVPENQNVISQLLVVTATDADVPLTFHQTSNFPEFELTTSGNLNLVQSLDRERISSYQINIMVTDATGRSSATVVFVSVEDVNDNSPIFTTTVLQTSIPENTPVTTSILQIGATDEDIGTNGFVTFSLSVNPDDTFRISQVIGTISLIKPLDFEAVPHYHVVVVASDGGAVSRSASTTVSISITDSSDLNPVFNMTSYFAAIPEQMLSSSVLTVFATDSDLQLGNAINYDIENGNDNNAFDIGLTTGTIEVISSSAIDREIHPNPFILTIKAFEATNSSQSAFVLATIELIDANDEPPVFVGGPFYGEVAENSRMGYSVVTGIAATDADTGDNALFNFRIDAAIGVFTIDSDTGELVVSGSLDREVTPLYTFEIVVFGRFGTPTLSSSATIVINVTDVNDNSPSFSANQFALSVTEEQPIGVSIGTVAAVDRDSGTSGQVAYSLTGLFANRFSVDGTGQITTQAILDRESVASYEINLVASDMDTIQPRQSTTLLIITVDDINDQNPYFTPVTHSVDVVESVSVPFVLLTVTASDDDIGANAVVLYSILPSSNPVNNFGIGTSSGVISVISSLDRETNENFILLIVATDTNSLTGTGTVLVTVIDANTENPMFSSNLYQATIPESTPLDTSVVQVMASDADTGANAIISFSLIPSADSTFFKIDSKLGNISIANSLDAEAQSIYDFIVRAEDNGFPVRSADSRVQVSVTDTNDNPPTFSATLFTTSVAENLPLTSTIMVLTATDNDIDTINNHVTYSLVSESPNQNRFSVLPDSGGVIVQNTLDREVADFHTLVVRGTDSGGLSDTTTLQVTVTDVNDNHPIIQPSYAFNFVENDVIGTRLGTVTATDTDEPNTLNSQLIFSIIGGATVSFRIDASTGEITSIQTIDRESTPSLNLTVQVSDSATVPLTDTSIISITVLDVNDNSPVFSAPSYSAELAERTGMGQLVVQVSASDSDEGTNQEIVFSITGGDDLNQFTIDGTNGEVRTTATPTDRETTSEYHLTLTASDRGQPSRQDTSHLRIQINDTNDNKPIFDTSGLFIELSENSSTNVIVATVSASDGDTGTSGTVRYQLITTTSLFSVDIISGVVRLVSSLDRETEDTHVLEITASDLGSPPLQADTNAILTISVTDSNDNSPQFVQTPNSPISVSEAENPAFVVDTYAATDRDLGANAVVTFTLSGGEGGFEVDRVSGELKVASQLDRETQDSYVLTITAIDGGPIPLSATATVLVSIGDVNDVTPTFPVSTPSSVNIKENLDIGQSVTTLTAVDGDIGVNKVVKYAITSSVPTSGLNTFQINEDSGHITVKTNDIDRENIPIYRIIVTATDLGNPPLSSSTNLEVLVSDVNDENPMFIENVYTETILENGAIVTAVLSVTATDADAGANGLVRYSISGPEAAMFSIDIESGEIFTNGTFDFETKSQYSFTATAVDNGNATRQGSATVIITIADLNDNHPSIQLTTYSAQLFEDATVGTVLIDVNATDRDTGANAVVKFEKISGSDDFLIDFDTGELKVSKALDRETVSFYSITVKAIDQGTPQLDSQPLIVQIDILDVNDNSPQFNTPITSNINIPEDTPVAMSVTQFFASDPDFGDNGTISFSLTGSNSFDVAMTTGVVRVSLNLDRETKDSYSLIITASDNGTPPRSVQSNMLISITDINDNAPIFNDTIQTALSIREDTLIGQVLVRVEASDLDLGINQEINFRLVDSNPITGLDTFGIDATSGDVFVAINNTDRESIGQYVLKIEALDGGVPVLSANLSIFITITDFNDNAPVFTQNVFDLSIPESTAPLSAIRTFSSTDNDEGVNSEVSYTISGGDVANFSINTSTGVLSTRDKFDFETNTFYTFLIIATDRGVPPLSGVKTVTVSILDTNDNAPILSDSKYSKGLLDSFSSGGTVFVFNATDLDSNNFGLVRFELVGRFLGFEVDREKGVLVSTGIFTGQVGRAFDFEIKAFDNEGESPTLFDIESVHVVVISQNHVVELVLDRSPEFVFSTQHSIEDILTRETELVVIIDTISPFYDTSNFIDPDKSLVTIHATHPTTSGLIETDALVRALDEREAFINELLLAIRVQLAAPIVPRDTTLVTAELALIIVSAALFLFIVFCGCMLCMLICQIFRIRRRKREYAKSYASLSTYIPSQSVLTSPTELMSSTNPLYTQPYLEKESYLQKTSLRRYESQELTMEMFGDDLDSLNHTTVVDLFDDDSVMNGRFRDAIDSVVESIDDEDLQVLVDYGSEDGSGISII